YIESLIEEFQSFEIEKLRTIYIGGGTPSVLSAQQLERLLTAIAEQLDLEVLEEFTVEANPGDLSDEVIKVLADSA
ncbi:oxygen-independent coproporphyrinogen III oxidase, partial [Klebsiella pneumoniae]|nr:oxygen-independent coproporphyrinogen III oxidase [Klebsiella pneumoniae]